MSKSLLGVEDHGIINVSMRYGDFINNHGGKLYAVNTTGHKLYKVAIFLIGLNSSAAKPSLIFLESVAKLGYCFSKSF